MKATLEKGLWSERGGIKKIFLASVNNVIVIIINTNIKQRNTSYLVEGHKVVVMFCKYFYNVAIFPVSDHGEKPRVRMGVNRQCRTQTKCSTLSDKPKN